MTTLPIAIVGAGCRLPGGVRNLDELWRLLCDGQDAITHVPEKRWSAKRFTHPDRKTPGRAVTNAAGIVDDVTDFDAAFFGIARKEAENLDPQQRIILETTWEALEDAGIPPSVLAGSDTAVYVGAGSMDAAILRADDPYIMGAYSMTATSLSIISNRVSYIYDLHGPSMTIDTACSSALVALHEAVRTLTSGGASMAIAGGVNILLTPLPFIGFSKAHMLSEDGRCKVFDASGNGYVRSEGGGVVVLKPLDKALADGDPIRAIIRATDINSDGRTTGIALPNQDAQAALLERVYREHNLPLSRLAYVEAHGTGTAAGDPVETGAIGRVLGVPLAGERPLYVGSIKSNVGHLETGSGMAGLFKAMLVLEHGSIPPNILLNEPNPHIDFEGLNLRVATRQTDLPEVDGPALAGLNSFGFGGTNVHVVLERFPVPVNAEPTRPVLAKKSPPLLFSARSAESLASLANAYADLLESDPRLSIYDLSRAIFHTRDSLSLRALVDVSALKGDPREACLTALRSLAKNAAPESAAETIQDACALGERLVPPHTPTAFAFSGNGCQWQSMGRALLDADPVFTDAMRRVDGLLAPRLGWSLMEEMRKPPLKPEAKENDRMRLTEVAQPMLFALQVALVEALAARGITPDAVYGHSVGEVAAAWACGALTLEDACTVIYFRSALQGTTAGTGVMAAVNVTPEQAQTLCARYPDEVELAGVNSAASVTLAGSRAALTAIKEAVDAEKGFCRLLDLNYPFHSRHMEPLELPLREALANIHPRPSRIPFISTVTGEEADGSTLDAEYWWSNIRHPVSFHPATETLLDRGTRLFLELGGHGVLQYYLKDGLRVRNTAGVVLPTLKRGENSALNFTTAWRKALTQGWEPAVNLYAAPGLPVRLPTYPWNKERLWLTPTPECDRFLVGGPDHPLLGRRLGRDLTAWENELDTRLVPWLADHVVGESTLFPAAAYLETAFAAARLVLPEDGAVELVNVALRRPFVLSDSQLKKLRLTVGMGDRSFRMEGRALMDTGDWTIHASGRIGRTQRPRPQARTLTALRKRGEAVPVDKLYDVARNVNFRYGLAFRPVVEAWKLTDDPVRDATLHAEGPVPNAKPAMLARLTLPDPSSAEGMLLPPAVVDGAFQTLFLLAARHMGLSDGSGNAGSRAHDAGRGLSPWLPAWFGRSILYAEGLPVWSLARLEHLSPRSFVASFELYDEDGNVLMIMEDVRFRKADIHGASKGALLYGFRTARKPHPGISPAMALPAPSELAERMAPVLASIAAEPARRAYHEEVLPLCDAATVSLAHELVAPLAKFGPFRLQQGVTLGLLHEDLVPYLTFVLELLEARGLARRDTLEDADPQWNIEPESGLPPSVVIWRTILAEHAEYLPEAALAGRVGLNLRSILQGQYDADAILSSALCPTAEQYNGNSPSLRPVNTAAVRLLQELLDKLPAGRKLRVLEVGAAPGGLTAQTLAALRARPGSYACHITDKDERGLEALQAFGTEDVTYAPLDIEQTPEAARGQEYHLILAGHVLHETENIHQALTNCVTLLAPGGLVAVVERSPMPVADVVLGIRPSWWNRSPSPTEPASRLMIPGRWKAAMEEAGLEDVVILAEPRPDSAHHAANGGDNGDNAMPDAFIVLGRKPLPRVEATGPAPTPDARWVILTDKAASDPALIIAEDVTRRLQIAGIEPEIIGVPDQTPATATLNKPQSTDTTKSPGQELTGEPWNMLFPSTGGDENTVPRPLHIVSLLGFDTTMLGEPNHAENTGCTGVLQLARAWDVARRPTTRLWILTGGAVPYDAPSCRLTPSQGALWGLGRVLMNEMSQLSPHLVDLHGATPSPETLNSLSRELFAPDAETEIMLHDDERYCPRLDVIHPQPAAKIDKNESLAFARLTFDSPGRLDRLYWQKMLKQQPGPGEVRITTKAVGLNFRDVMWAMGLLPDEALDGGFSGPTMGLEASGVVDAVGPGVSSVQPGDHVVCFAPSCFSSSIITTENAVAPKPAPLSFEAAASLPVTFFTAWYALKHQARLEPGQRVLIHGAAGGVGLAALQIANHLGLEVYATAGSPEKREFLTLLGVKHIFDSRSLSFAHAVMEATGGEGVDAVLNSLSGDAIEKGLNVLRPFGSFIELGKRDFYGDTPMHLRPFRNNISYYGVDVDQMLVLRPALARSLFRELMELFESGVFHPLPYRVFPRIDCVEAFRVMQQSRHLGKLIITMDETERDVRPLPPDSTAFPIKKDAAYLITGGLGGFGLATARRLAARGARNLVLLSRRGAVTDEAKQGVAELEAMGTRVILPCADVTDAIALGVALDAALADLPPLRGVIHAAAVLDDAVIANLAPERMTAVLRVKAVGAWNLHRYTTGFDATPAQNVEDGLDFFLLYSSATTALGNPGQGNYVAGNMAMENLAAWRRSQGLPGCALGFGPIADVGMLTRNPGAMESLQTILGVAPLPSSEALDALELVQHCGITGAAVFSMDWKRARRLPAAASPKFELLRREFRDEGVTSAASPLELIEGKPKEEAVRLLAVRVGEEIANILRLPAGRLSLETPVADLGMDSLMAVELGVALEEAFGMEVPSLSLSGGANAMSIAERVYTGLTGGQDAGQNGDAPSAKNKADAESSLMLARMQEQHGVKPATELMDHLKQTLNNAAPSVMQGSNPGPDSSAAGKGGAQ